jgi:putative ABC transport system substrate-binding protein
MKRREFIALVGGASATWPIAARAQRTDRMRTVSMLLGVAEKDPEAINRVKAFRLGMRDLGWIEGRNVQIDYRFARTDLESINKNVAEVVQLAPDVIVANSSAAMAPLRPATSTIPIVFLTEGRAALRWRVSASGKLRLLPGQVHAAAQSGDRQDAWPRRV